MLLLCLLLAIPSLRGIVDLSLPDGLLQLRLYQRPRHHRSLWTAVAFQAPEPDIRGNHPGLRVIAPDAMDECQGWLCRLLEQLSEISARARLASSVLVLEPWHCRLCGGEQLGKTASTPLSFDFLPSIGESVRGKLALNVSASHATSPTGD